MKLRDFIGSSKVVGITANTIRPVIVGCGSGGCGSSSCGGGECSSYYYHHCGGGGCR